MPYFDLHCHPGLKTLFQLQDGNQRSAWDDITPADGILGNILESQASLNMLTKNRNIPLICITLHPPEIGMIDQILIKVASKLGYPKLLNAERLDDLISQECSYQMTFEQEQKNLFAVPKDENGNPIPKKIKFLKVNEPFDSTIPDTLQVIFNIEGGHTFYDQKNRIKDISEVLRNLDTFLSKNFTTLYLTPTHLTPNEFITHAYGNKILSKGRLLPKGIGITPFGKKLIDHAYDRGIMIDVKHMSLVSRRMFYQYRKRNNLKTSIIASHVGFNGNYWKFFNKDIQIQKKKSYGYKATIVPLPGVIEGTSFYPLTINLYNDDIREILASGGLIGISLDVRILGGKIQEHIDEKEFFSTEEFELLMGTNPHQKIIELTEELVEGTIDNGDTKINAINEEGEEKEEIMEARKELEEITLQTSTHPKSQNYTKHLRLVLNHILHIYKFTKDEGLPSPWEHLCIGSDFDGLVEAVDCCRNATEFAPFAEALKTELQKIVNQGFEYELGLSPVDIIDKIMYSNAIQFINKYCR
ncbi:MAG: hypothetical protein EOO43_05005 [Flavobacterium sp.]|nr:MAG: hypothetical protein EOO43_05005 [Flavobacterium sp.]